MNDYRGSPPPPPPPPFVVGGNGPFTVPSIPCQSHNYQQHQHHESQLRFQIAPSPSPLFHHFNHANNWSTQQLQQQPQQLQQPQQQFNQEFNQNNGNRHTFFQAPFGPRLNRLEPDHHHHHHRHHRARFQYHHHHHHQPLQAPLPRFNTLPFNSADLMKSSGPLPVLCPTCGGSGGVDGTTPHNVTQNQQQDQRQNRSSLTHSIINPLQFERQANQSFQSIHQALITANPPPPPQLLPIQQTQLPLTSSVSNTLAHLAGGGGGGITGAFEENDECAIQRQQYSQRHHHHQNQMESNRLPVQTLHAGVSTSTSAVVEQTDPKKRTRASQRNQ